MRRGRGGAGAWLAALAALLALALVAGGVRAYRAAATEPAGLARLVDERLAETQVRNPVTAVLLDFRGFDTLLEVAVLLLAGAAAGALARRPDRLAAPGRRSPVAADRMLARVLLAPLLLVAAYLLWRGADAPGGALQAGAVAAAAAIAWRLGSGGPVTAAAAATRLLAPFALAVFLLAGAAVTAASGTFLDYPGDVARGIIFGIEVATAGSVACILAALFERLLAAGTERR